MKKKQPGTAVVINAQALTAEELEDASSRDVSLAADESLFSTALDQKRFNATIKRRSDNRQTLLSWVAENLRAGIDYGRIHVNKDCGLKRACPDVSHYSKPSLWKPGAEKICGMLGLNVDYPNLSKYEDAVIAGKVPQVIMLRCVLTNGRGQTIGVGVGARQVTQDQRKISADKYVADYNKTLKMAAKSAMIDATLRAGGLSEVFTQDIDDDETPTGIDPYTPGADPEANPDAHRRNINIETHCPIGREWRGRPWADVDEGFLNWIVEKVTDQPQLVARVERELLDRKDTNPGAKTVDQVQREAAADGSHEFAANARAVTLAKTCEELTAAWNATPEDHRRSLRKTYAAQRIRLCDSSAEDTGEHHAD